MSRYHIHHTLLHILTSQLFNLALNLLANLVCLHSCGTIIVNLFLHTIYTYIHPKCKCLISELINSFGNVLLDHWQFSCLSVTLIKNQQKGGGALGGGGEERNMSTDTCNKQTVHSLFFGGQDLVIGSFSG